MKAPIPNRCEWCRRHAEVLVSVTTTTAMLVPRDRTCAVCNWRALTGTSRRVVGRSISSTMRSVASVRVRPGAWVCARHRPAPRPGGAMC